MENNIYEKSTENIGEEDKINLSEKIYKLRKKGLTFKEIGNLTGTSTTTAYKKYNEIIAKKGLVTINTTELVLKEKIYKLKKEGLSIEKIAIKLNITESKAIKLYEKILEEKEEIKITTLDEKIYKLRKKGLSYSQILEQLTNEGIDVTYYIVSSRCKKAFEIKKEKEPKVQRSLTVKRTDKSKKIDEEIYYMVENGLSYTETSKILTEKGTKMGRERVAQRYRRTVKATNQQLIKAIMNLIVTRKATIEQIQQIAEIYGVDLEEILEESIGKDNFPIDDKDLQL